MPSREIWSKGGAEKIQGALASLLASLLLQDASKFPLYLCSPFMSDFRLLDNRFDQFADLFTNLTDLADKPQILFSETLRELSSRMPVRLVTVRHPSSIAFIERLLDVAEPNIVVRFAPDIYHEKGLLCDAFYIEGSMNFTYSGVYIRDEKVSCHTADYPEGRQKIDAAFIEFDLLWSNLAAGEFRRTAR